MSLSPENSLKHWQVLEERDLFEYRGRIRLTLQSVRLPDGRVVDDYLQVEMRSFALVFAETTNHLVLCFRQYRHGPRRVGLALPGGGIEPGEAPVEAVRRELLEETGYTSEDWRELGRLAINGNQGRGQCIVFKATGCTKVSEPAPDDIEEMRLEPLTREQLLAALATGEFTVASHVAAVGLRNLSTSLRHSPDRIYCRSPLPPVGFGGLIQTAVGGSAGGGARRTKRSGCAA